MSEARTPEPTPAPLLGAAPGLPPRWDTSRLSISGALRAPLLRTLLRFPLKKLAIWAAFLGTILLLHDFFGLIFLTFVLSYISTTIVDRISPHFSSPRTPVIVVFLVILGLITGVCWLTIPRATRQVQDLARRAGEIRNPRRYVEVRLGHMLGVRPEVELTAAAQGGVVGVVLSHPERRLESSGLLAAAGHYLGDPEVLDLLGENLLESTEVRRLATDGLKSAVAGLWTGVLYLILGLIFSFMIAWDRARLATGIARLETSRLGDVWVEVAPSIATFARLLGRAFEAQTVIAIMNTALTSLGMLALGIPGLGLLSLIVFVCSFVPIVGVYASTVPICLAAAQAKGIGMILAVIAMVSVVHVVEAYVLNPRVYGAHMKLHPLAVLVVLFVGGHLIGVWGLILGVPLATYAWRHLILGEAEHVYEPSASAAVPRPPAPSAAGEGSAPGIA